MPIEHSQGDFPEWIEVFETGTWTSKEGITREWTDADLEEIASSYDPNKFLAPLTIGHPEDNSPAYGWVEALKKEGNKLLAKPREVIEEFKDAVKKGLFRKVSMAIYPDMTLKHIGFLGGKAPALKGLKPVFFGEKKAGWTFEHDFSMESWQQETVKSIFQRIRDWMIEKFGREEADKVIGSYDLDALKPAPEGSNINVMPLFTEGGKEGKKMDVSKFFSDLKALIIGAEKELAPPDTGGAKFTEAEVQAREAKAKKEAETIAFTENEKLKKEKAGAEAKLKEIEDKKRKDDVASFCETLCKEGKLTPALRKIIEPVMVAVSEIPEPIEFSEGVKKSRLEGIKDFLTELPKVVTFREVIQPGGPGSGGSAGERLSALTKKKIEGNKDLSYSVAFSEMQKENPELAKEYLAEIKPSK